MFLFFSQDIRYNRRESTKSNDIFLPVISMATKLTDKPTIFPSFVNLTRVQVGIGWVQRFNEPFARSMIYVHECQPTM